MIDFMDCSNYRGCVQEKEDGGKYYWRVECDEYEDDNEGWTEIPYYLHKALTFFHKEGLQGADKVEILHDDDVFGIGLTVGEFLARSNEKP